MSLSLGISGFGMVTAVGYNAAASLAALRAGVSGVRTAAWADPESGEPIRCARVKLPQRWAGVGLMADLVAPAISECLRAAGNEAIDAVPLLIGISDPSRPGRHPQLERELLDVVSLRLGSPLHADSRLYADGPTGCAHALLDASQIIRQRRAQHVLVAGVDSFVDLGTVNAYLERRRILTASNFNGFLPGEAGSAVLVSDALDAPDCAMITGWGQAREAATIESTRAFRGDGMVQAARAALDSAGVGMADIGFRVTDLSGEHYKFKEAMFVALRLDRKPRSEPLDLWHPIQCFGEVGAAILPCVLAWAGHAMTEGYAPGPRALCHVGSDNGERAAFVVSAPDSARGSH